jgi:hypothetical protein
MRVSALPRARGIGRRVRIEHGGRGEAVRDPASGRSSGSPARATRRPARGPGGGHRDLLAEQRPDREHGRIVVAVKKGTSTLRPLGCRSSASRIRVRAFLRRPRVASASADERASSLGCLTRPLWTMGRSARADGRFATNGAVCEHPLRRVASLLDSSIREPLQPQGFPGADAPFTPAERAPCVRAADRSRDSRAGARSVRGLRRVRAEPPAAVNGTRSRR